MSHSQQEDAAAPIYDLVIKNGTVIDTAAKEAYSADVAVAGGQVAAVEKDIPAASAHAWADAAGCYVTPGLIDMHVHVFPGFNLSLVADAHSFRYGITTMVDTGSAGSENIDAFRRDVMDVSETRTLAFLNVVNSGMVNLDWEQDLQRMDAASCAAAAEANRDVIVGVKLAHYWTWQPWDDEHPPWGNVERALQAGERAGLPVMADIWPRPPERSYEELLHRLRGGDIHTHVYAIQFPTVLDDGSVNPALWSARERGVRFDVGHGAASFWFGKAQPALDKGFWPDTISTDLHVGSVNNLACNLLYTMGKFLNMGMPFLDVIQRVTKNPAEIVGRPDLGRIAVGGTADIAVLQRRQQPCGYVDCGGAKIEGSESLDCLLTVRNGRVVHDPQGLTAPHWQHAPASYWEVKVPGPPR